MPPELGLGPAVALGLIHGPAELLPVSSSAHLALVPRVAGWDVQLDGATEKAFEVALHTGTLAGLLVLVPRPPVRLAVVATLPPALAGYLLERPIEERLGGIRTTAVGLLAGATLMVLADALAPAARDEDDAGVADALALGLAQALALVPGVSRTGMTVTAGRLRGFSREAAFALSRQAALPVIAGATALKGWRLVRGGLPRSLRAPFAAGAAAALASTLAAAPLARSTALRAAALERTLLAVAALRHNASR
jgi:undecaprenyl-diphosphatase